MFKPTSRQQEVLDIKEKNIAVSASAGSGKTSIMIEKIANYICEENYKVKNMLIVTFTNSASAEMKERLQLKLEERINFEQDNKKKQFLIKESEDIENANICTIDKYCINLLRTYYYLLNLDGNFEILENIEYEKLKSRAFDITINEINKSEPKKLNDILDAFLEFRSLKNLKELSEKVLEYLYVQDDRENYISNIIFSLYKPILESDIFKESVSKIEKVIKNNLENLNTLILVNSENESVKQSLELVRDSCLEVLNAKIEEKHNIISNCTLQTIKAKKNIENKEMITQIFKEISNEIKLYQQIYSKDFTIEEMQEQMDNSRIYIENLLDFVNAFEKNLKKLKDDVNAYTFSDIEYYAYLLLKKDEVKLALMQDIDIIFVDEYQDVNKLQESIIFQMARKNNVFLVGDIKQSIYGFRLSEPKLFEEKIKNFADEKNEYSEQKNLNENFRSDKNILDFVNLIFSKCMTKEKSGIDYAKESMLEGVNVYENNKNLPKVIVSININKNKEKQELGVYSVMNDEGIKEFDPKIENEAKTIVNYVVQMLGTKIENKTKTGFDVIEYRDIAILFRGKSKLYQRVGELLKLYNIPVSMNVREDIYESLETRFMSNMIKLILSPYDDIALASVLSFPIIGLTETELMKISLSQDEQTFSLKARNYALKNNDEIAIKLQHLYNFINKLLVMSKSHNVYEIFCEIIKEYNFENVLLSLPNGKFYVTNLKRVLSIFSSGQNQTIVDYVNFLNSKGENKKDVTIESQENSVKLMTIHSSKGLEFKVVILAGTTESFVKKNSDAIIFSTMGIGADCIDTENKTKMPTIIKKYLKFKQQEKVIEEEKRLLYVALTRPKNFLIITGSLSEDVIDKEKSSDLLNKNNYLSLCLNSLKSFEFNSLFSSGEFFLKEINASFILKQEDFNQVIKKDKQLVFAKENKKDVSMLKNYFEFTYPFLSETKIAQKSSVSQILADENESKVAINLEPRNLEVNENVISSSEIGTTYHKCLELLDFSRDVTGDDVENVLQKMQSMGFDSGVVQKEKILRACKILKPLIQENANLKKEQVFIMSVPYNEVCESEITDEILVQGALDLLIEYEDKVIIVDYKNTQIKSSEKLKEKYAKQLDLYMLATKKALNKTNIECYLYSIQNCDLIRYK